MQCVICKTGKTTEGEVTVTLQRGEATVLIKAVPAQVCDNCGEYYLSDEVADQVLQQADQALANNVELDVSRFAA